MKKKIIMLEDDADDRYLTSEIIEELGLDIEIEYCVNSQEFFQALSASTPDLMLIDYNSTPENGLDVLKKIRQHDAINNIPAVILSEKNYPGIRKACYAAGAASVITKPRNMEETRKRISRFFDYWLHVAEV